MIALIQRVSEASVTVESRIVGKIGAGILALIGFERGDEMDGASRLLTRMLTYRIFADDGGRMNLSLADTGGGLLLVPQFTLAADTHKGTRPGFSTAAAPELARTMFAQLSDTGARAPRRCRGGRIRRPHEGRAGERRAGDLLAQNGPG